VLGQSHSPGFTATTADGVDLGEPTVVNGYANGWLVDPAEVGPDATITVAWTPQRVVWVALVLSAVGVLVCLALLVRPPSLLAGAPTEDDRREMAPRAVAPLSSDGPALALPRAVAWAAALGVLTALLAGWVVGAVVAAVAAVALGVRRGEWVARATGIALLAASASFVVLKQWRNDYLVDFNWMNQFEVTHAWTLAAVALLVADAVIAHLRGRAG